MNQQQGSQWWAGVVAFTLGFAFAVVLAHVQTGGCLTRERVVYVVEHRACVPVNAFVPAGYVPAPEAR